MRVGPMGVNRVWRQPAAMPRARPGTSVAAGYGWWRNPNRDSPVDWFIRIRSRQARTGASRMSTRSLTSSLLGWFGS